MRTDNWIQTYTGKKFWPTDPRPDEIDICDIAWALSNKCRYAGHCKVFYSVAQHSVIVSNQVKPGNELWGLLHDAAEAYLADVARPIKKELIGFEELEERLLRCVAERFVLEWPMPDEDIKRVDLIMLATEKRDVMYTGPDWRCIEGVDPLELTIGALSQIQSYRLFMDRYHLLTEYMTT